METTVDRLESMSTLVAVVEAGSLSAAARRSNTQLTTVSRRISDLEERLQTRLLNRSSRSLSLTDAGQDYLAACRRILDQVGEAERAAAGEFRSPKGELFVTAPVGFGRRHVAPIAAGFLGDYPDVDIRLVLTDQNRNLLDEHIDVAVRIGALADSRMLAVRVGSIRRVVCASPAYLEKRGTPGTPGDLAAHDCVSFDGFSGASAWSFPSGRTQTAVPVRSRLAVNNAEAAVEAAIAGVGVTRVLSYQSDDAVRRGELAVILAAYEPEPLPVNLLRADGGMAPLKLRAFLDYAGPRLRSRLTALES